MPRFRHAESPAAAPFSRTDPVVLLADEDFPPFSFRSRDGQLAGIAVDMALATCAELKLSCEVLGRPYDALLPALQTGEAEAIVSGPHLDKGLPGYAETTRPYFWSLGRFATRTGSPLEDSDYKSLAGKRIGSVKDSAHAAWLERHFPRSTIVTFETESGLQEALRTGTIDALFGDSFRVIFWISGSGSRACCKLLGGPYTDRAYFSRDLGFIVKRDNDGLLAALDHGLDRLQERGFTSEIFARYLPLSPW
ncbi:MAG: transporter substrate-binding domain-containing protein [Aestuariivirga sp.]